MTTTNHYDTTLEYFETWLGEQHCLTNSEAIQFIHCAERNTTQYGYPGRVDVYCWLGSDKIVVSYGDRAQAMIGTLKVRIRAGQDAAAVSTLLHELFGVMPEHHFVYAYKNATQLAEPDGKIHVKTLCAADYGDYERFYASANPDNDPDSEMSWFREYFDEMMPQGYFVGVYADGALVCCTDGPGMPYMPKQVQEVGIETLREHRGRGYAALACTQMIKNIIAGGKAPQWSTSAKNLASQKLAAKVGFVKIADVLKLKL